LFIINQQFKTIIMAVEKSKVITRIKTLFPKANLSQKRLDALADKLASKPADDADDVAIDAVINDFNSVLSIDEIAREDDRVRTLDAKANPPVPAPAPTPAPTNPQPTNPNPTDDVNQKLLDALTKLTGEVEAIKTGNVLQTKKQTASQLFEKSEVLKGLKDTLKPKWIDRINVDSETPIEDQIKELETEYSELVQVNADNNQYGGPAGGGSNNTKPDDAVVSSIVDNLNI
jgi:hypothetical protein